MSRSMRLGAGFVGFVVSATSAFAQFAVDRPPVPVAAPATGPAPIVAAPPVPVGPAPIVATSRSPSRRRVSMSLGEVILVPPLIAMSHEHVREAVRCGAGAVRLGHDRLAVPSREHGRQEPRRDGRHARESSLLGLDAPQ